MNNIKYTILYGTLLGSIRHNGFIPWDDDFDFAVHEDYENILMNAAAADLRKYNFNQ